MAVARQGIVIARAALLWCVAAAAYIIGRVIGIGVTLILWFVAALIAGYKASRT